MKTKMKTLVAAITLLIMLSFAVTPSYANSRAPYWEGTDSNGVIFKEGDVPIEVESELLTFDIPTLPYNSYRSGEYFLEYDSKVTAEYTFYNPTDMTITATLLFPFGEKPEYSNLIDKDKNNLSEAELNKYDVTVNGQPIEKRIRHTYKNSSTNIFDADEHIASLSDEYLIKENITPDTPVTKYTYTISGVERRYVKESTHKEHSDVKIHFNIPAGDRIIIENDTNINAGINKDGYHIVSYELEATSASFSFFVIGESYPAPSTELIYYTDHGRESSKIKGEIKESTESMTLEELFLSNYDEASGVSKVDWYNAAISELTFGVNNQMYHWSAGFPRLIRWYEYQITIGPGEKITNSVTAPIYPSINNFQSPIQYEYTYLLSPASGWADFGRLDIVINTDYEMNDSNLEGFEKTENGYKLTRDGLPKDAEGNYIDLRFSLLNDGNTPLEQPNPNLFFRFLEGVGDVILFLLFGTFILISGAITWIVSLFR